jgi:hypothetical protein
MTLRIPAGDSANAPGEIEATSPLVTISSRPDARARRVAVAAGAALLLACGSGRPAAAPASVGPSHDPSSLAGRWCTVLAVRDVGVASRPAPAFPPRAEVTLGAAGEVDSPARRGPPRYGGSWRGDLSGIGVERDRGTVGPAVARVTGEYARIELNPERDHGILVMSGRIAGDAITGGWEVSAYAVGAKGTFRMQRRAEADGPCA